MLSSITLISITKEDWYDKKIELGYSSDDELHLLAEKKDGHIVTSLASFDSYQMKKHGISKDTKKVPFSNLSKEEQALILEKMNERGYFDDLFVVAKKMTIE